jgi:hypothetical protein
MHLGKTHRFKKIASNAWHVGAGRSSLRRENCRYAPRIDQAGSDAGPP